MQTPPTETAKPVLPWAAYSWQVHVAGVRATEAARRQNNGAKEGDLQALGDYAAGGTPLGEAHYHAPSAGGYAALQAATALFDKAGDEMPEMGVLWCFAEPEKAWKLARTYQRAARLADKAEAAPADFLDAFNEAVFQFSCGVPLSELRLALGWLKDELAALQGDGKEGAENPPMTAPGTSTKAEEMPTG